MIRLIKLDSIVVVEGKYDKITLENIIDAKFVVTNGFGIYKDSSKRDLIKTLCEKKGAVIITDSDYAGAQIRAYIKSFCNSDKIINVYLPQIKGKEKRKCKASKQGFLGAEGMTADVVIKALSRSGVTVTECKKTAQIKKSDLYVYGLSGGKNSKALRDMFSRFVSLPEGLSSNAFLDAVNTIFTIEEFKSEVERWQQETKN